MYTQQRAHTYDYKESNLYPGFMPGRLQTAMTSNVKKASAPTHVKQGDGTVKSSYTGQNFQLELSAAGSAISGTSGYNSSGARGMSMSVNSHPNQLLGTNCGNLGGSSDLLELESYGRGIISVAQINNAAFNSKSMQGTSFNSQNYSASKEMYLKIQSNDVMARWSSEKALIAHNGLSMTEHQGNPLYQSESSYASTLSQHWNMNYSTESQSRYVSNNHASMTKSQPLGNLYSGLSSAGHMMGYDGYGNSASYEGKNQQQLLQHQQLQQVQAYNQNSRPQPQQYFDPYSLYVPVQHSQTVENQSNIFEKTNVNSQQPLSAQFVVNSSNAFMSNQHIKPNNDALALNHYFEPKNKPLFNQRLAAGSNASKAHQSTHATPLYGLYHSESNAHYTQHHHALLDANFMHTGIRAPTSFLIQPPNPHAPNAPPSATLSEALHLSCGPDLPSQTPGFATFVTHALLDILGGKVTNQGKPAIVTKSTDSSFGDLNLYVENVLQTTDVSRAMTMLALKYISMLCAESSFRFETGTEKNIIIFGLMLANKILDDHTFTNRTWSDVSKISLEDLNLFEVNCLNILKHDHLIVQRKTFSGWVAQLQNFWVDFRKPKQVLRPSAISQRHDYYQNHEVSSSLNNVESHYSNSHHVLLQQKYNGPLLESANSKYFHSKTSILRPPTLARSAAVAADGFVNDISRNPSLLQTYGLQASSMDSNSNKNLATTRSYSQQLALMQNQGVPSSSNFKPHSGADRSKVDMNLYESLEDDGIDTVSDATITAISTPYREFEQRNFYDPSHLAVPMTSSVAPNSVLRHPQSCPGCFECFRVDASQHMLYQQQQQIQSHQQQVLQQHNIGGGGFSHTATHLWPAQ